VYPCPSQHLLCVVVVAAVWVRFVWPRKQLEVVELKLLVAVVAVACLLLLLLPIVVVVVAVGVLQLAVQFC